MGGGLKPGQQLRNGEIEIIDLVGSGGIGDVYRASMVSQGTRLQVAVKCFNPEKLQQFEVEAIEMVHRESLAISRIHHPNIVRILSVDLDHTLPFITEEFLAGHDLGEAIAQRKKLRKVKEPIFSALEIVTLGQQISAGLMVLHQENQYHGDLKPSNLCFRSPDQAEIVIVDFGHSGFLEGNLLDRNEKHASLAYLPPERTGFVKMAGNASSDLYSLGVTLYEAATGEAPFSGYDSRDLVNRLLYEVPRPLHEVFSGFPILLSDIISKLLRKNPQDRYHSAFGLSADLGRCLQALQEGIDLGSFALGTKDKLRELNYRIPMVGRNQEITLLLKHFEKASQGGGSVALIGAPSGTGKSRLAFEVLKKAREHRSLISYAKFSEYERNLPLSAISILLVEHSRYLKAQSSTVLKEWQNRIKTKLGIRSRLIGERYPCYEGLLPETVKSTAAEEGGGFQVFNQCLGEFLGLLSANHEDQLILIDDLQWADWQSLQVFGFLAQSIWGQLSTQIMFMGTYRSNEVHPEHPMTKALLDTCPKSSVIQLGPLDRGDSDQLVEKLLEEHGPEVERLQDLTYRFTAGNPFYIYEYLKSAIHSGIFALDQRSKAWHFHEDKIHEANLSTGVAGLVADRIRSLKLVDQALIGIASLAGQSMDRRALIDLLPKLLKIRGGSDDHPELKNIHQCIELAYQELVQKNLLVPDKSLFRFFHDKIQEASYSLLSEPERKQLHPAFGLWCALDIKANPEEVNDSQVFEAAYHLCKGDQQVLDSFACEFLISAAKLAQKVFSYEKAKDFLSAVITAHEAQNSFSQKEKFEALELLANTLTISDQVKEALILYDRLLEFDCTPLQRASIYCKKSEFGLSVLDFRQARDASFAGLEALKAPYLLRNSSSSIYLLIFLPCLALYALFFHFFGRQTKEMNDETETLRFQLQLKNQLSQHMVRPIVAIANLVLVTFELLAYKDCYARATVFCYWGVVLGPFGLEKLSSKFLATAYEYFDRNADPVSKGQVLYFWGYLCDFPAGNLSIAQKKLEDAISILEPIGESFWRSMSIVGLLSMDYYGSESGQSGLRSHEILEQWKKLRFEPSGLAFMLRNLLERELEDQVDLYLNLAYQSALKSHHDGFDSVETLMAWLCMGEYHEFKQNFEVARRYYRHATWLGASRFHRSGTINYAPLALARVLIEQKKVWRALIPLAFSWSNQLLNVRIFLPQTFFVTGSWLDSLGWSLSAQRFIEAGIDFANRHTWTTVAAEGQLLLGRLLVRKKKDIAAFYLQEAKAYYHRRGWIFSSKLCDEQLILLKQTLSDRKKTQTDTLLHTEVTTRRGAGIRQQIEIKSLLEVLLKLSAINEKEALYQSLMESLCQATGSELALLIFKDGDSWTVQVGHNIKILSGEHFNSRVDQSFLDDCTQKEIREPMVREHENASVGRYHVNGSVMMVPMVYEARIYGYCYLGNTQIYELFDKQSMEIAGPIAIQGAIALQNINLNNELEIERDQISQLHQTLEQRVNEQTRDIKSIMQHIKMGICTISGVGATLNKDYSLFLERLLHKAELQGQPFLPLLLGQSRLGSDERDQIKNVIMASMNELEMVFNVNDHILPRTLQGQHRDGEPFVFELDWIPISNEQKRVDKILVAIHDVTALRGLEERAALKDQELQIISEILGCSTREWLIFIGSSLGLVQQNTLLVQKLSSHQETEGHLRKMFINLHTIKGNARALGCKLMNETIHDIEQYFSQLIRHPHEPLVPLDIKQNLEAVRAIVERYHEIAEQKLGRTSQSRQTVSVGRQYLHTVIKSVDIYRLVQTGPMGEALNAFRDALYLPLDITFRQIFSGMETLAIDLGKAKPLVKMDLPNVWVTDQGEETLRQSFVHLLRNSLDHGIESPEERTKLGKSPEGTLEISARVTGHDLEIRWKDDGRGLNLKKLAKMGLDRQLLTQDQARDDDAVAALIFSADFSTADRVSDISGRGVGMTAAAQYIQEAGGSIHIEFRELSQSSEGFRPFEFIVLLPLALFQVESRDQIAA